MLKMIQRIKNVAAILIVALLFSCSSNKSGSDPKQLVIAAIPGDDVTVTLHHVENFSRFLEKKLDMKVNFYKATDYAAVIEAMKTGKIHVARLGPFSYVLASQKAGAEVIVALGTKSGEFHSYQSMLLTYPGSGINSLEDAQNKASDISFSFVDPASTSGHLVPRAYLNSIEIEPEENFKQVTFSTSHAASLLMVKSHKVDMAAANNISYRRLTEQGKVVDGDFNILWKSAPIVPDPWAVSKTLSPELKEKIREAFVALPKEDPEAWKEYISYQYKGDPILDSLIYISANDSVYDNIRAIANNIDFDRLGN